MSQMIVLDEKDGDRMWCPDGESDSELGVSVCPRSVITSSCFRRSYTYKMKNPNRTLGERKSISKSAARQAQRLAIARSKTKTHMDGIVDCTRVYL